MKIKLCVLLVLTLLLTFKVAQFAAAWTPKPVGSDPLVRMPGTQPDQGVNLEAPNRCLNCHAGYNESVEPGFNWMGSMMAQSARDPIFWACLTVAAQDSIWALDNPNAVDICERCHFPEGWLGGRSDPPNASAMTGSDFDGIHCDFCHTKWDPFFETTYIPTDPPRESADWLTYWDETNASSTPSQPAASSTYSEDMLLATGIKLFSGSDFFVNRQPKYSSTYTEDGSGQYFISTGSQKRASFADAAARHQMLYSRHHKSKYFCGTCHDVSNPALANMPVIDPDTGQPTGDLTTEKLSAGMYFHVERTFSEFMLSAYGQPGGALTNDDFQAQGAPDITHAAKCQDCHMRDVVGVACNKKGAPVRPDGSIEHPNSGQPLHDLTGGNAWISRILASLDPNGPVYDSFNAQLLDQGPAVLTLNLNDGETPKANGAALLAGANRAKQQLLLAATITNLLGDTDTVDYDPSTGELSFRIQNNSAHKLISGFPEGRRMFVNIKCYSGGNLVYEMNPYDYNTVSTPSNPNSPKGTLRGLPNSPNSPPLGTNEAYVDELVYEVHPKSSLTGEDETFHFVLADGRYKDNRIPPKGFDIGPGNTYQNMKDRLSEPVSPITHQPDVNYFTDAEYAGGYDEHTLTLPAAVAGSVDNVVVALYYQGTSREYIEFLRDEINGTGNITLPTEPFVPGPPDPANYIAQTDSFFAQIAAWGDVIWDLWFHNHGLDGSGTSVDCIVPFMMTQAAFSYVSPPPPCSAPVPTLDPVQQGPGNLELTLTWSDEHTADENVIGYSIYYDQAGKAQFVASVGLQTTYTDTGLTKEIQYCYKVTSLYAGCESDFSNVKCAIAKALPAGVNQLVTGIYAGKGKNATFTLQDTFNAGDSIVIRAYVVDKSTGLPLSNASVDISVDGLSLSPTSASDTDGIAETTWNTSAPNKRGQGGTPPGTYTATVTNVTASGYSWDMVRTSVDFTIQ
jgi:hypothetical protein